MNALCFFCHPDEYSDGKTPATRVFRGKPACEGCYDYGCEQDYNDQQAEEGYAQVVAEQNEPGPAVDTAVAS